MIENLFPSINTKLLPIKIHYLLFNIGTGPVVSNISIIARQKGFSTLAVGTAIAAQHLVATLVKPFFGWIADRFKLHKFIFILMQAITALCLFSIYFITTIPSEAIVRHSMQNRSRILFCPENPNWDTCLEQRIQTDVSNSFRCNLKCLPDSRIISELCKGLKQSDCLAALDPLEYEMMIDMSSIAIGRECLVLEEFAQNSTSITDEMRLFTDCEVICENDFLKSSLADKGAISDAKLFRKYEYWIFFALLLIGTSASSVVYSLADTICYNLLGSDSDLYGRQRMWDSIGSGIVAILIGYAIDMASGHSVFKDYSIVYFFCLVVLGINIVSSMTLQYTPKTKSKSISKELGKLVKSVKTTNFVCWCCMCGVFSAMIWTFEFWHLEDLTDAAGQSNCGRNFVKTMLGIAMFFQCTIGEIPIFYWSGSIQKRLGHINCMHLICTAFAMRFFYYAFLIDPWWVIPIEVLNGLTYGLFFTTMTSYVNMIAPAGTEATLQGIAGAVFEGVGVTLGNVGGGVVFNAVGGSHAFFVFGIAAISVMILHVAVNAIHDAIERNRGSI